MLIGNGYAYPPSVLQRGSKPLLDAFPGATMAFSLRKLRTTYTGPCVRVRNDANQLATINFAGSGVDTTALLAHAGTGNCYVETWYNQASGAIVFNLTQTTNANQPVIVSGGAMISFATNRYGIRFIDTGSSATSSQFRHNPTPFSSTTVDPFTPNFANVFISAKPASNNTNAMLQGANSGSRINPVDLQLTVQFGGESYSFSDNNSGNDSLYTIRYAQDNLTIFAYRNKTILQPSRGQATQTISNQTTNPFGQALRIAGTGRYNGVIGEIINYPNYNRTGYTFPISTSVMATIQDNIVGYFKFPSGSMVIPLWIQYGSRVNANGAATAETAAEYQGCLNLRFDTLYNKI